MNAETFETHENIYNTQQNSNDDESMCEFDLGTDMSSDDNTEIQADNYFTSNQKQAS